MIREGDDLPNPSTVVRYVGFGRMFKDDSGAVVGPAASAFECRPGEPDLSVTWCEYFLGSSEEQLRCAIEAMRASLDVKSKACFCVANTDALSESINSYGGVFRAVYLPRADNPAHAGVFGVSADESELLEKLAAEAWCEFFTKDASDALSSSECSKGPHVE